MGRNSSEGAIQEIHGYGKVTKKPIKIFCLTRSITARNREMAFISL